MLEELKPYLEMAGGLTEMTRQRATEAAKALIAQGVLLSAKGGASDKDVREVADEVLGAVQANRDLLLDMIRGEVHKATGAMGFVHADEVDAVRRHVERLERQIATLKAQVAELAVAAAPTPAPDASAGAPATSSSAATSEVKPAKAAKAAKSAKKSKKGKDA